VIVRVSTVSLSPGENSEAAGKEVSWGSRRYSDGGPDGLRLAQKICRSTKLSNKTGDPAERISLLWVANFPC